MKGKLLKIATVYLCLFIASIGILYAIGKKETITENSGEGIVLLNRAEKEAKQVTPSMKELEEYLISGEAESGNGVIEKIVVSFVILGVLYVATLFLYVYEKILKPFDKLEKYAEKVAGGDLDITLEYEQTNYFGAFTWAFDHMREEIKYARKREQEAIEGNKTVIASLSHDIKTPIASIRAYSEALEAGLDTTYEKRQMYTSTIMNKCDEVTGLVNDLVLHSLSELEKLEINLTEVPMGEVVRQTVLELGFSYLNIEEPLADDVVIGDPKRVAQIIENLLNNARKYAAEKPVYISSAVEAGKYFVRVRDTGTGIPPEDMPFVLQKFYRGKNVEGKPGSGLGLYIVKYLVEAMQGGIELHNSEEGLEVEIFLPLFK